MTAVQTTPPPRLPVRHKAAARDRGWGGVSPMLTRLAAERATGVLVRERGSLHLAGGRVVHADSPSAPGLEVLLTAHGTVDAGVWRQALAETGDRHRAGHLLVDGGHLAAGALELCRLTALYDAAYFALAPSSTPGRFRYGTEAEADGGPGPACGCPMPVAALERETLRRRDLLHRIWPDPTTDEAPLTRAHRVALPPPTSRQRAVLAVLAGSAAVRTATDIARELGRPAFHTLVDIRRLAAAGAVRPRPPAPAETPEAPDIPDPLAAIPTDVTDVTDPHITLLKRLRDALEAL
ncbi:transcriptional regulator [Streptomyces plumbiresistens]|uniref:Transcriptional regulator n=1 Tax=Streptomyces plumbiresistens TaxID=511811 RepID=A0ABP7Q9S7_9ACTN